jgi:hypothetical protein
VTDDMTDVDVDLHAHADDKLLRNSFPFALSTCPLAPRTRLPLRQTNLPGSASYTSMKKSWRGGRAEEIKGFYVQNR